MVSKGMLNNVVQYFMHPNIPIHDLYFLSKCNAISLIEHESTYQKHLTISVKVYRDNIERAPIFYNITYMCFMTK